MEDKESGSLSEKSTLDLIVELYRGNVTGSLKLERAPLQKAVYFRDGQILFAASNDPKDQLASILVEEGKLGPDQMQVAQARVSAGNPLAKVLTELGYISQRELADAARIKVEKILTDLYTWTEGTYQFATKSLPKGAIDLDLSTPQLIYASIGRIQDRDWILRQLGSLDAVIAAGPTLDNFIIETKADDQASEVLHHVDAIKSVTQIGALSRLGEFEVCKILAAGLVAGALTKAGGAAVPGPVTAPDDAFSMPSEPPTFNPGPSSAAVPLGGLPTVGLETNPPPSPATDDAFRVPTDDTVFEAPPKPKEPEQMEKTVFEAAPGIPSGLPTVPGPTSMPEELPSMDFGAPNATASELLIDEPEPDTADDSDYSSSRMPPRPKGRRGGASSDILTGILKIAGVIVLVAGAAFSVYYFIWPMFAGEGEEGDSPLTATATPPSPSPTSTPPAASSSSPDAPDTSTRQRTPTRGPPGLLPAPAPRRLRRARNRRSQRRARLRRAHSQHRRQHPHRPRRPQSDDPSRHRRRRDHRQARAGQQEAAPATDAGFLRAATFRVPPTRFCESSDLRDRINSPSRSDSTATRTTSGGSFRTRAAPSNSTCSQPRYKVGNVFVSSGARSTHVKPPSRVWARCRVISAPETPLLYP